MHGPARSTGSPRSSVQAAALTVALALTAGCAAKARVDPPAPGAGEQPVRAPIEVRGPPLLLTGGRVMTAAGVIYERGDVLIEGGRIKAVGVGVARPADARVIDVAGKVVTPGIIDTHSHMGVYPAPHFKGNSDGNEIVGPNTAYARAADGFWPQDPQIDHARAGGVTTAQILPGSANLIGGRSVVVKLRPRARSVDDMRFMGAKSGLKMACGENPKRVYGEKAGPNTRMGNVAGYRDAFQKAAEYREKRQKYAAAQKEWDAKDPSERNEKDRPTPPDRDFGLETLAAVLDGEILVHMHCYRADEMSLMLDLAKEAGFSIRSFHHAVEAYKIADRLAAAGTASSVWADWWGFKAEAFDGVRENAAMLSQAGARAIIHSDSAIGIQRLNQEAAKAMYAGQRAGFSVSEDEALRWITVNPAWALGIDGEVGTLEPGKVADVVVWSGSPFSVYSLADQVYLDGALVYDRARVDAQPRTDFEVGFREGDLAPPAGPVKGGVR